MTEAFGYREMDKTNPSAEISLIPKRWPLICTAGEPRLNAAMACGALVILNDTLLVKLNGLPLGVAFKEKSVPGGVVVPGVWYAPHNLVVVDRLLTEAFMAGEPRVDIPDTEWMAIQPIDQEQVPLETIVRAAANLNHTTVMQGTPQMRGEYRYTEDW